MIHIRRESSTDYPENRSQKRNVFRFILKLSKVVLFLSQAALSPLRGAQSTELVWILDFKQILLLLLLLGSSIDLMRL